MKRFITSFEELRRWATMKIETAHNIVLLHDRIQEVWDAYQRYNTDKAMREGIEVEE